MMLANQSPRQFFGAGGSPGFLIRSRFNSFAVHLRVVMVPLQYRAGRRCSFSVGMDAPQSQPRPSGPLGRVRTRVIGSLGNFEGDIKMLGTSRCILSLLAPFCSSLRSLRENSSSIPPPRTRSGRTRGSAPTSDIDAVVFPLFVPLCGYSSSPLRLCVDFFFYATNATSRSLNSRAPS